VSPFDEREGLVADESRTRSWILSQVSLQAQDSRISIPSSWYAPVLARWTRTDEEDTGFAEGSIEEQEISDDEPPAPSPTPKQAVKIRASISRRLLTSCTYTTVDAARLPTPRADLVLDSPTPARAPVQLANGNYACNHRCSEYQVSPLIITDETVPRQQDQVSTLLLQRRSGQASRPTQEEQAQRRRR
jgi:hypothetical protein